MRFDCFTGTLSRKIKEKKDSLLFLCIGTNEIIWDSVGPTIGTYLEQSIGKKLVLGSNKQNIISSKDIMYNYELVKDRFIIAIDAAISPKEMVGEIFISNKPLIMGIGLNNNKGMVGDISIKIALCDDKKVTKAYVNNLAQIIANRIAKAYYA